ncbi:MAG: hypothetical protein WAY12_04650, partial [Trichococcus flocculiformis]
AATAASIFHVGTSSSTLPFHTNTSNILFFASQALVLPTHPRLLPQFENRFHFILLLYSIDGYFKKNTPEKGPP